MIIFMIHIILEAFSECISISEVRDKESHAMWIMKNNFISSF